MVKDWRIVHYGDLQKDPLKVLLNMRARYIEEKLGGEPNELDNLYFTYKTKEECTLKEQ